MGHRPTWNPWTGTDDEAVRAVEARATPRSVWLKKVSATEFRVIQCPIGAPAGNYVSWRWNLYGASCWDLYGSEFCRLGTYSAKVDRNGAWTLHNPDGGTGTWEVDGQNCNRFQPLAGYVANSAYAEITIPDGTNSIVVEFEFRNAAAGVATITIDGAVALVNGRDLTLSGAVCEVDHYGTDNVIRPLELAHDLPAGAHTLRIAVKSIDSHASGLDDVCINAAYFITAAAEPDATPATLVQYSTRCFQSPSTSDLSAFQVAGITYGGSEHGNEVYVGLGISADGVDLTWGGDMANGTVVEAAVIVLNEAMTEKHGADAAVATLVKKLTINQYGLVAELTWTWAALTFNAYMYPAMFSAQNCNLNTQWRYRFWYGSHYDWSNDNLRVPSGTNLTAESVEKAYRLYGSSDVLEHEHLGMLVRRLAFTGPGAKLPESLPKVIGSYPKAYWTRNIAGAGGTVAAGEITTQKMAYVPTWGFPDFGAFAVADLERDAGAWLRANGYI